MSFRLTVHTRTNWLYCWFPTMSDDVQDGVTQFIELNRLVEQLINCLSVTMFGDDQNIRKELQL